jgi:hypothetical protein
MVWYINQGNTRDSILYSSVRVNMIKVEEWSVILVGLVIKGI